MITVCAMVVRTMVIKLGMIVKHASNTSNQITMVVVTNHSLSGGQSHDPRFWYFGFGGFA